MGISRISRISTALGGNQRYAADTNLIHFYYTIRMQLTQWPDMRIIYI